MVATPTAAVTVASSDGVDVAVHHLAAGDESSPVLISHATGFHGLAYAPLAQMLGASFDVWALDHRGHGLAAVPDGWKVAWAGYADDAEAAAVWLSGRAGGAALIGVGHSMGGTSLLIAAHRHPELFRLLVLYEPIANPPGVADGIDLETIPIVIGARRRRAEFGSRAEALANFASKPPMDVFDPAALQAYVDGGFVPIDPGEPDGPVRLRCDPQFEADTFVAGFDSGAWDLLPDIDTPTVVVGGPPDEQDRPSLFAPMIAERLPRGEYHAHPELDHFGPFTHPAEVAAIVRAAVVTPGG